MEVILRSRHTSVRGRRTPGTTPRTLEVAGLLGLALGENVPAAERRVRVPVRPGQIVLITGPSGAGKTTLLRAVRAALQRRHKQTWRIDPQAVPSCAAVIDAVGAADLSAALECLSRAGLYDAHVLLRRVAAVSEGERFRFELARWYASAAPVLLCDEFCATLDHVTARIVSHQLRRFVSAQRRSAVVATCREDLADDLRPDVIVQPASAGHGPR